MSITLLVLISESMYAWLSPQGACIITKDQQKLISVVESVTGDRKSNRKTVVFNHQIVDHKQQMSGVTLIFHQRIGLVNPGQSCPLIKPNLN